MEILTTTDGSSVVPPDFQPFLKYFNSFYANAFVVLVNEPESGSETYSGAKNYISSFNDQSSSWGFWSIVAKLMSKAGIGQPSWDDLVELTCPN